MRSPAAAPYFILERVEWCCVAGDASSWGAGGAGGRFQEALLSGGTKVLQQASDLLGEGPKPLRFLCFLGKLKGVAGPYMLLTNKDASE